MKSVKTIFSLASFIALASSASAMIEIQTSFVGDAGNANDTVNAFTNYGGVSYNYHIGTYEVTNSQYVAFLNAKGSENTHGVFNTNMESNSHGGIQQDGTSGFFTYSAKAGFGNKPVNFVSFWDAARFSNWLTNGQGNGDTESGVYVLTAQGITDNTVTRNAAAWAANGVAIASEDEWYKAAYYSGSATGADGDGYWLYPTQSDSISNADANYSGSGGTVTDVGAYSGDASHYGTFDQGGNVWEWNDAILFTSSRALRGGSFSNSDTDLQSSLRGSPNPTNESRLFGFRVSSLAPIPEPSAYAAILGCLALAIAIVRRKGRGTL
jgi:formylglycine-generating enzyme required for sulfatase activity